MSKELDKLSDTMNEYVTLFDANPPKPSSFTRRIADSFLFCMLFFPLVVLVDDLKTLKNEKCIHVVDAIEAWIKFLLLGGAYTAVAVAICTLLYRLSLLPAETQITLVSIILVLVLIIAISSWLITRWANKK
jgi:hypothetical protein